MNQEKAKIRIDVVSDVACPWCYIGKRRIEQAIENTQISDNVQIIYHPFQLDPSIPNEGVDFNTYAENRFGDGYLQKFTQVENAGKSVGLDFEFEALPKAINTFHLHRFLTIAAMEGKQAELEAAQKKLTESQQATDAASRKAKLAEEAAARTKTMAELLSPLAREKRAVMEELLESVKTQNLREAFQKYLPAVLNEGSKKTAPQSRQTLSEAPKEKAVAVTGDQRNNRLLETVQAEDSDVVNTETATILKLAGLKK